ncbi:2-amino-4-hydroxy-6-hydroxymethyldihydropteridine diphosphokinase [Qipengyuania oceanensis]|uniref:2-amino-4-hydroxy-6-hydroxymethyldihydropteridine pyrophosphokinase n=1 Tax=Qipengyuania oceanensis TaxID=1463597 RepID=A0A844YGJ2_9SPHN|nr:2-amino-4-hydroxy-6-hydroxymethyldihydropteridine diphosphokinase [Qipengyuania oceanensis]MXO62645.1 2-amino-4-hydroxy-6-hydroxymethyldihydropteridine diphosphokinase [Qipengyuania oceanensis]
MRGHLTEARQRYLVALGSNMRVSGVGNPRAMIRAAMAALEHEDFEVLAVSPIITSAPVGPSQRCYANAAAMVETAEGPQQVLARLQRIERAFGRRRRGQRWRARPLDLDIVLWSGGIWASPALSVPHPLFRRRAFVLGPAASIAPGWRDPVTGLTLAQLDARLTRPRAAPSPRPGG